jgi:hypothetical protein
MTPSEIIAFVERVTGRRLDLPEARIVLGGKSETVSDLRHQIATAGHQRPTKYVS